MWGILTRTPAESQEQNHAGPPVYGRKPQFSVARRADTDCWGVRHGVRGGRRLPGAEGLAPLYVRERVREAWSCVARTPLVFRREIGQGDVAQTRFLERDFGAEFAEHGVRMGALLLGWTWG